MDVRRRLTALSSTSPIIALTAGPLILLVLLAAQSPAGDPRVPDATKLVAMSTERATPAPPIDKQRPSEEEPVEGGRATAASSAPDLHDLFRPDDGDADDLPLRRMPYEEFAAHASEMIARVPSLDALHAEAPVPAMTDDIDRQIQHIRDLDEAAEVTVEGYESFTVDVSRERAFADLDRYHEKIEPKMFIVHWTGWGYDDVDHFVTSLRPNRVQYFMDRDANTYRLFESDRHKPAHVLGANDFSQGVEIETGPFDGVTSPVFSYTPKQIEHTVYLAVDFLRRNDLPVDETTLLGHYAADLIFTNPYYYPHDGTLTRARVRKFDPPEELMGVIVGKAKRLNRAIDPTPHRPASSASQAELRRPASPGDPAAQRSDASPR